MPKRPMKKTKENVVNMPPQPQPPELTLNDFEASVRIIDVASRRGAFEGSELTSVGAVRDKIQAFVKYHVQKNAELEKKDDPKEEKEDA